MSPTASRWALRLGLLAATALILAAAASLPIELDEAYYWCWSRSLGFSYLDHPPGIAWALALSTAIFGDGRLGLRIFSVLSIAIVASMSAASSRRLGHDPRAAILTVAGAVMITIGYLPATPDPYQGAILAVAAYAIVRSADHRWSFIAGVAFGAAIIFKHSSALITLGAIVGLARSFDGRKRITPMLLGLALSGFWLVPWILADLDGGSLAFQGRRVLAASPRFLAAPALLFGAMLLTFGPAATIALGAEIYQARKSDDPAQSALAGGAAVLLLGCLIAAALGAGELNWPLPALIFALPGMPTRSKGYWPVTALSAIVGAVVLVHVIHPFLPISPAKDRTLRSAGYDRVAEVALAMADTTHSKALITRRYQAASVLRYYGQDRVSVIELSTGRPSQFGRWPQARLCEGETAVLAVNHPGLSEELVGHAQLAGETAVIDRGRGDRVVEQWYVTSVRMIDSSLCEGRR